MLLCLHETLMIEMLHLEAEVSKYYYLNQSGCTHVLTMDDDRQFSTTLVSYEYGYVARCRNVDNVAVTFSHAIR